MRLLLRWLVVALALLITASVVPGIRIEGSNAWVTVAVVAVVLGLVNATIRPLLSFLSCGLIILTLGLFTLVINAVMLGLSSWIAVNLLGIGFYVDGFVPALIGAILVSIISALLSIFLPDERE